MLEEPYGKEAMERKTGLQVAYIAFMIVIGMSVTVYSVSICQL
jgi:hypothetical protein